MEYIPISVDEIESEIVGKNKIESTKFFKNFLESGDEAWKITEWMSDRVTELNVKEMYGSIRYYAHSSGLPVRVIKRNNNIYLVRG